MSDKTNPKPSSSKKKLTVGVIIAVLVVGMIGAGAFYFKQQDSAVSEPAASSAVSSVSVSGIHFKEKSLTLKVGETAEPEIVVEPEGAVKTDGTGDTVVKLVSSDPAVVKVDSSGKITAAAPGSATVTATLKDDETVKAAIEVTVAEADTASDTSSDKKSDTDKAESKAESSKKAESSSKTASSKKAESAASSKPSVSSKTEEKAASSKPAQTTTQTTPQNTTQNTTQNTPQNTTQNVPQNTTQNTPQNTTQSEVQQNEEPPQEENESSQPEEVVSEPEEIVSEPEENNSGYQYIDPNSVGKKIPIGYVATDEKKVSISFDASWGNDKTQKILDTLDEYNIKSTFFLVGIWVRAYPDDVKKIADAGHDIGNHSNTHPDLTQLGSDGIRSEMEICSSEIEALTGQRPTLFRNPYGAYDDRVVGTALGMGMDCIQWDVDTLDWTGNSGAEICNRIRSKIRNGSIILMHNAGANTADSLPAIIQTIYDMGYEIVPISELVPENYTTDYSGAAIPTN